jgi:cellulose synthase/poly-beta-1,6-N-acetylglucosamine synthase-like glycosyltransferase
MNCPNCNGANQDNAIFCKECGTRLDALPARQAISTSDLLLIIYIAIAIFGAGFQFILTKLVENAYEPPFRYLQGAVWMIQNVSWILLPLAIKNRTLKPIALVVSIPLILYWLYTNIQYLTL